jgi:small subunit ribosomal protein S2
MEITQLDLLQSGVHFGHQTRRWNPKMKKYIYGESMGSHIIDLDQTIVCLNEALNFLKKVNHKNILFVGTKKQIQDVIKDSAEKLGAFYINNRWPGGLLTNFKTVTKSLSKLDEYEKILNDKSLSENKTKLELLRISEERDKLLQLYGGIIGMTSKLDAIVIVDIKNEQVALKEAKRLLIPVVAIVDTNVDPDQVDYPIPGNDDGIKSVSIILNYLVNNILK